MRKYEKQTQEYSTFGDKLLQHTDVLNSIQNEKKFKPITIQLAPTEACDSKCIFCSVANRNITSKISFDDIVIGMTSFKKLGAKAVEITGGGNPLIYRDGKRNINDVIEFCVNLGLDVGIITNSENYSKYITSSIVNRIKWIRISLSKLDEGKNPSDFILGNCHDKIGLSYIINKNTTVSTIRHIAEIVGTNSNVKFVRIAPDCLVEDSLTITDNWGNIIDEVDKHGKFFIKEINDNFHPHVGGCWVGMLRPYWVHSGIYICTSHVLINRNYQDEWKLCNSADEIYDKWAEMNSMFKQGYPPYKIDTKKCGHCYYTNNNKILDSVITVMSDRNFA